MQKFQKLYKKLNPEQKEAVDSIEGPVMIIAGPGTGKTFTLTMRIANILLKTDTDPSSILALTFTENGAKVMRERLLEIIGTEAYYININTFHAFCTELIRKNPELFFKSLESIPLSDLERIQLFKKIIDSLDLTILKPANKPYSYIQDITKAIKDLKREGISPYDFKKLLEIEEKVVSNIKEEINPRTGKPYTRFEKMKRDYQKQQELRLIYERYQEEISNINKFDFEDMINLVVDKLVSNENFKLSLQENFLYIHVDEYQDTNSSQNKILQLLTDHWENPNIFVVGDDEQSIYRFQGASLENILYFKKLFKNSKIITLTSNYRSSQIILDASRNLISKNLIKLEGINKNLKSLEKHKNIPIKIAEFSNEAVESYFIAKKIKSLIEDGIQPNNIAVLVRRNNDIDTIQNEVAGFGIQYEVSAGINVLEDHDILKLLKLLRIINDIKRNPSNDIDLFTVLNYEFIGINELDTLKISRFASKNQINIIDVIFDKNKLNNVDLEEPEKLVAFGEKIKQWIKDDSNYVFTKFFEIVVKQSGFLKWILNDRKNFSKVKKLNTLFNEIKKLNASDHNLNLEKFLENIDLMTENGIGIFDEEEYEGKNAVKLLTVHKAKGLEFEYVFIAKCIDKKWGNSSHFEKIKLPESIIKNVDLDKKEKNEDERRLFYVALTRAKKQIYITYASRYGSSSDNNLAVPSMFISEIASKYKKKFNTRNFEEEYKKRASKQLDVGPTYEITLKEKEFLASIIDKLNLNVTGLNTYLKCPYKFKINNILKTPRAKSSYMAFGTAIHEALEKFFQMFKLRKKIPKKSFLISEFKKTLEREILNEKDFKLLLKKGTLVLNEYYENNYDTFAEPIYTEYTFGGKKVYLKDIPLSGKVDKIEWVNKLKRTVKVVDYKTGSPKTRREIEGKTKNSDGDLIRQIYFYKLLSDLDITFNYNVVKGEFDFVESKPGKRAKKVDFVYSKDKIDELKELIIKTAKNIRDHIFPRTNNIKNCESCEYKDHCWEDGLT